MKISELEQPRLGDIVEFEIDQDTVVEGLIVGETDDGYIYEFGESGLATFVEQGVAEGEYQGREVPLGRPMRGDVKKFKVYVRNKSTGKVLKVNFGHGGTSAKRLGQTTMRIRKSNPERRKNFRARHRCHTAKDRTSARYWSCRAW